MLPGRRIPKEVWRRVQLPSGEPRELFGFSFLLFEGKVRIKFVSGYHQWSHYPDTLLLEVHREVFVSATLSSELIFEQQDLFL